MQDLATYLNDHLAGSIGALEMLDDLIQEHDDKPLGAFLKTLRGEIESDQEELKRLIAQLGIGESGVRKAGAWVAEKLSRVKLRLGGTGEPSLALLQSLESLSLGIAGKGSLWRNLGAVAQSTPRLRDFDFARLEKRAAEQGERVAQRVTEIGLQIFPAELNHPKPG